MQSLFFGPTPPQTKTHWILLDTHYIGPKSAELYQLSQEESLPTKLIISAALSQDNLSTKFPNFWNKSKSESTKLFEGTQTSKKVYDSEEAMKSPSTSKNKQLIPQSPSGIPRPIEKIQSTSLNTFPRMLTQTKFIAMWQTNTTTSEESSLDSIIRKEKTTTIRGYTTTKKSVLPRIYHSLNSQTQSQNSKSSDSSNLNH